MDYCYEFKIKGFIIFISPLFEIMFILQEIYKNQKLLE